MQCTNEGLALTKAEIGALLEFCSKDKERPNMCQVKFTVKEDRCFAYATDGHRAIEADGSVKLPVQKGEWLVRRDCLVQGRKVLERNQVLRLCFSHASLHEARIEQDDEEVAGLDWPEDAAVAQQSFPNVEAVVHLPHASRDAARCVGLNAKYLMTVRAMARAAGTEAVDVYPPKSDDSATYFRATGETVWTACLMPIMTEESSGLAARKRSKKNAKQPELPGTSVAELADTLKKHGATLKAVGVGKESKKRKTKASTANGAKPKRSKRKPAEVSA
jgi:hypothetical protein